MKHIPKIGAFVLETLTTGMYANPFDALREYVQNSSDAIFLAERQNIIPKNNGRINIKIDPVKRSLEILDNGVGLSSAESTRLLNIGMSSKIYGLEAGFRGIGRLAGIAYCKQLVFNTTYINEDERCTITFDCEGIRRAISPAMRNVEELVDVLRNNTHQDIVSEQKKSHFFEVKLIGIDESESKFLDLKDMEDYLSQVAPVEYDGQKFDYAAKIEKSAKEHSFDIPHVSLLINSPVSGVARQVFKPFRRSYKTRVKDYKIDIKDVAFQCGRNETGLNYWMWYSKTDLLGMFDDTKVAGLRFRKNNIAIGGPERVAELFQGNEGRLNNWLIGEVHIINNDIIPNARRDGFESTPAWNTFREQFAPFIKEHCKACHDASSASNRPTVKVVTSARTTIDSVKNALKVGLASTNERVELLNKLEKEEKRVHAAIGNREDNKDKSELSRVITAIQDVRKNLQNQEGFTVSKIKTNLDRKQKRILIDIMEIIDTALRKNGCKQVDNCLAEIKRDVINKFGT